MAPPPETKSVVPENLTDKQVAEAKQALEHLVKYLARVSARACHELHIAFDMDDPQVAREVMKMTFDAVFYSQPLKRGRSGSAARDNSI